ncbi:hypothetical protein [Klebsiella pneumoniae]|uniref:hypothetical protein n=1 Tax=Klebsiella pneumoniae TaxID=573 RepID=UPI003A598EDE
MSRRWCDIPADEAEQLCFDALFRIIRSNAVVLCDHYGLYVVDEANIEPTAWCQ